MCIRRARGPLHRDGRAPVPPPHPVCGGWADERRQPRAALPGARRLRSRAVVRAAVRAGNRRRVGPGLVWTKFRCVESAAHRRTGQALQPRLAERSRFAPRRRAHLTCRRAQGVTPPPRASPPRCLYPSITPARGSRRGRRRPQEERAARRTCRARPSRSRARSGDRAGAPPASSTTNSGNRGPDGDTGVVAPIGFGTRRVCRERRFRR